MLLAESRILLFLEKWDPTNGRVREKEMSVRCEPSEPLYCLQDIKIQEVAAAAKYHR